MASDFITILAHRGLWRSPAEKNTAQAVGRALAAGFGVEIDVRDQDGQLVVAHDVNEPGAYPFSALAAFLEKCPEACIALNVKSCGLQSLLSQAVKAHSIKSYFTFDMAVPDLLGNIKAGLTSYTRQSEIEPDPVLYDQVQGVWMDMFERDWITADAIAAHLRANKDVALVSPELHRRPHKNFWQKLKDHQSSFAKQGRKKVYLCTDYPDEAAAFFNAR